MNNPQENMPAAPGFRGNQPRSTNELSKWLAGAPPQPTMEPAIPIVDAHHHLFGDSQDRQFYRLEDLQGDANSGHRIIGTVYVEAYEAGWHNTGPMALRPVGEVERIVGITARPMPTTTGECHVAAAIVGHADLTLGDGVIEVLHALQAAAKGRLRGIRQRSATVEGTIGLFNPNPRPAQLLRDSQFRRGFAHLAGLGLSFDAWIYHTQIQELIELVDAFPNTTVVVNHVAGPLGVAEFQSRRKEVWQEWSKGITALAARPNVIMKVGGLGMAVYGFGFEQRDHPARAEELAQTWAPYINTCVEAFGSSRCMFESNAPVDKQSCTYGDLWNAFKLHTQAWSRQERGDMFYRSACRVYRLPMLESIGNTWR